MIFTTVLTKTVAGSAEALHLRRTIDRLVLLTAGQVEEAFNAVANCCDTLVRELHFPGRGTTTMKSSHVLLLCLHLWRSVISGESSDEAAQRGDGPRLVGNFRQMVELHYRDGWPIARYAAALGVTDDKLHAHCKREKGISFPGSAFGRATHAVASAWPDVWLAACQGHGRR